MFTAVLTWAVRSPKHHSVAVVHIWVRIGCVTSWWVYACHTRCTDQPRLAVAAPISPDAAAFAAAATAGLAAPVAGFPAAAVVAVVAVDDILRVVARQAPRLMLANMPGSRWFERRWSASTVPITGC